MGSLSFYKEVFQIQEGTILVTENLMARAFSVFNYTFKDIKCSYRRKNIAFKLFKFLRVCDFGRLFDSIQTCGSRDRHPQGPWLLVV